MVGVSANQHPDPGQVQGANLYRQSCGTCHLALPPEVMPSEAWRQLLQDNSHFGQKISLPEGPILQLIWGFMRQNSRPLIEKEETPYRLQESRYFKALHPQVTFATPPRVTSCIDCHPKANLGDFVSLTPKWL